MKKNLLLKHQSGEKMVRTTVKTITYRILIIILDFTTIYILTGKFNIAIGFTIISNVYTTVAYFLHERVWDNIKWGMISQKQEV
jgi:uncharacterized membrane protein